MKKEHIQIRSGMKFHDKVIEIIDERKYKRQEKERLTMENVTNLIAKHSEWDSIKNDIVNLDLSEVKKHAN